MEEFESLQDVPNEQANNKLVRSITDNADKFEVEVVAIKESSLDGQPIIAGEVSTPNGIATFDFLKSRTVRPIGGTVLNISINGERKSKFVTCYTHAMNTIAKLCRTESYWNNIPTK